MCPICGYDLYFKSCTECSFAFCIDDNLSFKFTDNLIINSFYYSFKSKINNLVYDVYVDFDNLNAELMVFREGLFVKTYIFKIDNDYDISIDSVYRFALKHEKLLSIS